jgi:hypothetical protein
MSDRGVESNRRGVGRQRVLKKGLILFNDGRSSIGCHIVDISDTGAKLAPVDVFSCPGEFLLKLPLGEPRECEVMWRRGDRVGVRFGGHITKRRLTTAGATPDGGCCSRRRSCSTMVTPRCGAKLLTPQNLAQS